MGEEETLMYWEPFISSGRRKNFTRTIAFVLLMVMGAAVCNAVMDTLQFHFSQSVFARGDLFDAQWWNPELSWRNKWENGDPKLGERFFLSSTALVALTDAWHFFKGLMLLLFAGAIVLPISKLFNLPAALWILFLFLGKALYGGVFELFFRIL